MKKIFNKKKAKDTLEEGYEEAQEMLKDEDKMERFLQRLEKKLSVIPLAGNTLSDVPVMASLLRSFVKKEYTDIPIGTITAVVSALVYFVSPIDLIPDLLPGGYIDDAAVIGACLKLINSDVEDYIKWRKINDKAIGDI
ncbi:MAG: YkvA family protein [Anaerococcus sp.]